MEFEGNADTLLTQITRDNPSKLYKTQLNGSRGGGYVVLCGVILRSKELKIRRSLQACRFKSGTEDHMLFYWF